MILPKVSEIIARRTLFPDFSADKERSDPLRRDRHDKDGLE